MGTTLHTLFTPWSEAFANSLAVSTTVIVAHLLALLFGGGYALAADRATLRALRAGPEEHARLLHELRITHGPVLVALAVLTGSGVLLVAADIDVFLRSPLLWLKLTLFTLLLLNGAWLRRTEIALRRSLEDGDAAHPVRLRRLRTAALLSMTLWSVSVAAGVLLMENA